METLVLKPLAFKTIIVNKEQGLEDVIKNTEDDHSYFEEEFGLNEGIKEVLRLNNGLKTLVVNIFQTYQQIQPQYFIAEKPKRNLTDPCEGLSNNGKDNIDNNLIVFVQDEIKSPNHTYIIEDSIGQGISGQVFKVNCEDKQYAMKVIKNRKAYLNQALIELKILEMINKEVDKNDQYHIIRIFDYFYYYEHLIIIFELLNENLYQLLQHNHLQGISLSSIRFIMKQILEAVEQFHKAKIIHCDLKPENILLKIDKNNPKGEISVKVIDFGSACSKGHTLFKYIQSRYYRAPEVIIGLPYSTEIDIWSIGCIAAELYLGGPLLPGSCEFDQLKKIEELLGEIPDYLLIDARNFKKYYKLDPKMRKPIIKSNEEYYNENPKDMNSKYKIPFDLKTLDDLINIKRDVIKKKDHHSSFSFNSSICNDDLCAFIHFLKGLLQLDPKQRWNAKQCLRHPFITKDKLDKFLSFYPDEVSQFLYFSGDNSQLIDHNSNRNSYNPYHSMMMNKQSYNAYSNNNSFCNANNPNVSYENMVYQPNLQNIQLGWVKQFPYAMVEQCNLFPSNNINNPVNQHLNQRQQNNSFMTTSFEKINPGKDFNYFKQKQQEKQQQNENKNKQNKKKGKHYNQYQQKQNKINKYLNVNSFQQSKPPNMNPNFGNCYSIKSNYYSPNINKRDLNQEYEGLERPKNTLGQYMNKNNGNGDGNSNIRRTRSQSDHQNPNEQNNNNNNIIDKNKIRDINQEIAEEDNQNEDEFHLSYNQ